MQIANSQLPLKSRISEIIAANTTNDRGNNTPGNNC